MSFQVVPLQDGKYYNIDWDKEIAEDAVMKADKCMCDSLCQVIVHHFNFELHSGNKRWDLTNHISKYTILRGFKSMILIKEKTEMKQTKR